MEKILLMTGASSDVGIKLLKEIESDYSKIICHYFSNDCKLIELKKQIGNKLVLMQGNFNSNKNIEHFVNELNKLDYSITHVVHLPAKKSNPMKFHKTDEIDFIEGYNIAVLSIVKILRYVIPRMDKNRYGKIVFMLSSFTTNSVPKFQSPYITIKYALLGLMRDLAREYISKGIRVNAVSPQMMETKFLLDMPDLVVKQNALENPLGRNITIEEVIPIFKLLLSEDSDAIVGENISVTGGGGVK